MQAVNSLYKSRCGMRFGALQDGVARGGQSTGCETHTGSRGLRREHGGEDQADSPG